MKKAVTIGLAGVTLAATLSLVAAGSLQRRPGVAPDVLSNTDAPSYVRGPRIIRIPEPEPASLDDDVTPPRSLARRPEHRSDAPPAPPPAPRRDALSAPPSLFDGPTPIRPTPRFKVKADSAAANSPPAAPPRGD